MNWINNNLSIFKQVFSAEDTMYRQFIVMKIFDYEFMKKVPSKLAKTVWSVQTQKGSFESFWALYIYLSRKHLNDLLT